LGVADPFEEAVGRHLGDPLAAVGARLQVLVDHFGRTVVELAQAVGVEDRVGRVGGRGGVHRAVSGAGSSDGRSPKRKGRFRVEPVAKTGIYPKRSPASSLNRLRTRDLARMTAFSVRPNSSATRPAGTPSTPNRWNASQVFGLKSGRT